MQKLQLSIPNPCHENWQQMTPTAQGRFCNACAKEVVDLSMMTDTEVLNYFTTLTHEKVCGRALPSQLERTISRPKEPKKRLFWYWNYIVMFFMFFGKGNAAKAQGNIKPVTESVINLNDKVVTVAGYAVRRSLQLISGKVTDKDGYPVSFATIKIKGTPTGISADANGVYSIKINSNDVLVFSAASFKTIEVPVGAQSVLNTVLEKAASSGFIEVIVTDGINLNDLDYNITYTNPKYTALLQVKDDNSGLPIDKARISFTKNYTKDPDTVFTDKKGVYKLKRLKEYHEYSIKVEADGYEANEFTINGNDFKDRKKTWEISLRKQKLEATKSTAVASLGKETMVRLGGVSAIEVGVTALYVVDGTIRSDRPDINPDDIEDVTVLQAPQAMAVFGVLGSDGAIVITTRQSKIKNLDTVAVSSDYGSRRMGGMTGGISFTYQGSYFKETIVTVKALLTDSIKVYPNPVQRNTSFSVSLKLKQAGNYSIQITDASGRILLQQTFSAVVKDHTEKIMGDSRWAGGVYYIRVFDAKNKLISKSSFIFQ